MEYFKLRDGNKLPVIALGPGAVVRKEVLPYAHLSSNPIVKIGQKVVNKLIYEKESLVFINNVARGINLGFEPYWQFCCLWFQSVSKRMAILKSNRGGEKNYFLRLGLVIQPQPQHRVKAFLVKSFDTNYVDLLQFHWPVTRYIRRNMERELQQEGMLKQFRVLLTVIFTI